MRMCVLMGSTGTDRRAILQRDGRPTVVGCPAADTTQESERERVRVWEERSSQARRETCICSNDESTCRDGTRDGWGHGGTRGVRSVVRCDGAVVECVHVRSDVKTLVTHCSKIRVSWSPNNATHTPPPPPAPHARVGPAGSDIPFGGRPVLSSGSARAILAASSACDEPPHADCGSGTWRSASRAAPAPSPP